MFRTLTLNCTAAGGRLRYSTSSKCARCTSAPDGQLPGLVERTVITRRERPAARVAGFAQQVWPRIQAHGLGKAVSFQDAHRIGVHDDPGPNRVQLRGLFQHCHRQAANGELAGEGQPADAPPMTSVEITGQPRTARPALRAASGCRHRARSARASARPTSAGGIGTGGGRDLKLPRRSKTRATRAGSVRIRSVRSSTIGTTVKCGTRSAMRRARPARSSASSITRCPPR